MNLQDIKPLLGILEDLSIDTQPIRDLLYLVNKKEIVFDNYQYILETIKLTLEAGSFSSGDKVPQIEIMLSHLHKMIDSRELENKNSSEAKGLQEKDKLILSTLIDIKKDIDIIKNKQPIQIKEQLRQEEEKSNTPSVGIDSVFINPIIDTSGMKSNFSVKEKLESNISCKLDKLKQLKRRNT